MAQSLAIMILCIKGPLLVGRATYSSTDRETNSAVSKSLCDYCSGGWAKREEASATCSSTYSNTVERTRIIGTGWEMVQFPNDPSDFMCCTHLHNNFCFHNTELDCTIR